MFQRDVGQYMYPPKTTLTSDMWEQLLDTRTKIRERVERQTPWRKGEVGEKLCNLCSSLSRHAYGAYQIDVLRVTIPNAILTKEECLAAAALLEDYVLFEFDPLDLWSEYNANEERSKK